MFKVIIALEEAGQAESLTKACWMLIQKVREMIKSGKASWNIIYGTCMIEAEIDGVPCMLNFKAIVDFSHAVGILKEDGSLSDEPVPCIPPDVEKEVFLIVYRNILDDFISEHKETLTGTIALLQKVSV